MKMERYKNEIVATEVKEGTKEIKKTSTDFEINTIGRDIVRAIVDETIVPKIIQEDIQDSKDVVQNIIEEVLVSNIINCDSKTDVLKTNDTNVNYTRETIANKNDNINKKFNNIDTSILINNKVSSSNASDNNDKNAEVNLLSNSFSIKKTEVVDLGSEEDKNTNSSSNENSDDETGDPSKSPGRDANRPIDPDHLLPFHHGWKREVVMKVLTKNAATQYEIFYIPPADSPFRTRESKRKRKSKMDQERYFDDFPHKQLSVQNFSYVPRPLGLNNAAYEIIRKPGKTDVQDNDDDQGRSLRESLSPSKFGRKTMGGVSYKEVEESTGLIESGSSEDEDEEIRMINGFDTALPLSDQITLNLSGMKSLHKKRRKYRNPETCCTPPLAEDRLWSTLDDDPLGIYHSLGGRSSPTTPPPLRAVRLTPNDTAIKIASCLEDVKNEAASHQCLKEIELGDGYLASHDVAIKKFKNVKEQHYRLAFARNKMGQILRAGQPSFQPKPLPSRVPQASYLNLNKQKSRISQQKDSLSRNSPIHSQVQTNSMVVRKATCSVNCPGARRIPPTMQCINCRHFYHAKCQGVSNNVKVFKCRACVASSAQSSSLISPMSNVVRVKLPMVPVNGKRPIVELVMMQGGKYQPIKFSNNMQVTEEISKRVFDQANNMKKTIYQRAKQVPNVGNRPIYLAVNPSNPATGNALKQQQSKNLPTSQSNSPMANSSKPPSANVNTTSDQVSILVKQQNSGAHTKPVLLNVPRKVALKVKTGTTLSFSASNDQKYVVIDNKIHPPVKVAGVSTTQPRSNNLASRLPIQNANPMKNALSNKPGNIKGNTSTQMHLPSNLPKGLSIKRTVTPHAPLTGNQSLQKQIVNRKRQGGNMITGPNNKVSKPTTNILATGEILSNAHSGAMNPCTPYCPGVNGFPELECTGCQSLFHSKCVGISSILLPRLMATWKCRMCTSQSTGSIQKPSKTSLPVQVIELD